MSGFLGRLCILLVEDEQMISEIAAEALIDQGFEVHVAANAGDALRHLKSGSRTDILFTDINLPGHVDGISLAQLARQFSPHLPVVFTSGRAPVINRLNAVEGAIFVPKPYDPFELGPLLQNFAAPKSGTGQPKSAA